MCKFVYLDFLETKITRVYVVKLADSQMHKTIIWNAKNAWPKSQKYLGITAMITRYL